MKFSLLFGILFLSFSSIAEYGTTIYELNIYSNGEATRGFIQHAHGFEMSPITSPQEWMYRAQYEGEQFYFSHDLFYYTQNSWADTLYIYIQPDSIPRASVDSIKIVNTIQWTYLWGSAMTDDLTADDYEWLNSPTLDTIHINIDLCEYTFHFHEVSPELLNFRNQLQELQQYYNAELERIREEWNDQGHKRQHEHLWQAENEVDKRVTERLGELLVEYDQYRVIGVVFCSC